MKLWAGLLLAVLPAFAGAQAPTLLDVTREGDAAAATALIKEGADVRARKADGTTALHWAAHHGELELVKRLIKAGADVNARNDYGSTPLQVRRCSTSLMARGPTPYFAATATYDPTGGFLRISKTAVFVSFAPFPRHVFSAVVTASRWSGFTHAVCRHRWSITSASGTGPWAFS